MMLQLAVYDTPQRGILLADWSRRVAQLHATTNAHGFASLTAFVQLPIVEAFRWYSRQDVPYVRLSDGAGVVWDGRLEDVKLTQGGITISVLGYVRALSDQRYTALWSTTDVTQWQPITAGLDPNAAPDRFAMDTNNRIYITPQKGSVQGTVGSTPAPEGSYYYLPPNGGRRQITQVVFGYTLYMPTGWVARLDRRDSTLATISSPWSLTANGSIQSGLQTITFVGCDSVVFALSNPNPAGVGGYAIDTGQNYFTVTSVRVMTTTAASVTADAIVADQLALAPALAQSTALIQAPGTDLFIEQFEDMAPVDIIDHMTALGDSTDRHWEYGVYEDQRLFFRPRGSAGRAWYVDATTLDIERTLDALANSAYATYQDANGRTVRTVVNSDAVSLAVTGLTRQTVVNVQTTDFTQASTERDTALADGKQPAPRATLTFDALYDSSGARYPVYWCRAGDSITIRNVPPTAGSAVDRIRTFIVSETDYDADTHKIRVVPETPPNTMDVLVARLAEGIN